MGDFGKMNFSVSMNPTSAFPLDARQYFNSLALAKAAAATAEEVGSTNTVYYYGMQLFVDDGTKVTWYTIQRDRTLLETGSASTSGGGSGVSFTPDGTTVILDENNVLKVNTADEVKDGNLQPVTSNAVFKVVGDVETSLSTL